VKKRFQAFAFKCNLHRYTKMAQVCIAFCANFALANAENGWAVQAERSRPIA
jgi:hypothetical protein